MVAIIPVNLTLQEFLTLPETKPYSEYFDGKIQQKPIPQGEHSIIQTYLSSKINEITKGKKIALALTELRCTFEDRSIVPDISIFTWERIPTTETGKIANRINTYPDWVIEILSPEQSAHKVIKKNMFCLQAGTQLAWLIDSDDESVMIFKPKQFPQMKSDQDILPVLTSLLDLQLSAQEIFSWLRINEF